MKEIDVLPSVFDLVEKTNGEVAMLMVLGFCMGALMAVSLMCLWVQSLQSELRAAERKGYVNHDAELVRRLKRRGL